MYSEEFFNGMFGMRRRWGVGLKRWFYTIQLVEPSGVGQEYHP